MGLFACSPSPGEQVFTASGCPVCHNADLSGTAKGPPLKDLRYLWTPETLSTYMNDPAAYVEKDARLTALKETYRTIMPRYTMDETDQKQLITYLLAQ